MASKVIGSVREVAKLVDLTRCTGCRACQVACKSWNQRSGEDTKFFAGPSYQNPAGVTADTWCLVKFHESDRPGVGVNWTFQHYACMHCSHAKCVDACPVKPKARDYHPMGFTFTNWEKCIGCGMCTYACPYKACSVKQVDKSGKRLAFKCWFCMDRVTNGDQPACAKACRDAIFFGDRKTMIRRAKLLEAKSRGRKVFIHGQKEYGGLHMLYLVPAELAKCYDLAQGHREVETEALIAQYLASDEGKALGDTVRAALQAHMDELAIA